MKINCYFVTKTELIYNKSNSYRYNSIKANIYNRFLKGLKDIFFNGLIILNKNYSY